VGKQFWKQPAEQVEAPAADSAYYRRTCDLCSEKAIYRWGKKAVCGEHKDTLKPDLEKSSLRWEALFGQYSNGFSLKRLKYMEKDYVPTED